MSDRGRVTRWVSLGLALACALLWAAACSREGDAPRVINGAGATLPYPLYARWSAEYAKVEPKVRINYQSVGSGAGVRQVADGVVDFGGTDEPMSDGEVARASGPVLHVPTTVGAVAITYNLPGPATQPPLELTPELVADLFLGVVTRWDDPRVLAANPGRAMPAEPVTIVHRADGSGTSAAFTSFLSKTNSAWKSRVGTGTTPRFPVGVGVKGNEGVAAFVKQTPSAIGYIEVAHARIAGLPAAHLQNRSGAFVAPTVDALDRAARSAARAGRIPNDVAPPSLVDAEDPGAYPITTLSWVVVPREPRDAQRGAAVARFLWWAIHEGQRLARPLDYAELPPELVTRGESALREMRSGGHPLLPTGG